MPPFIERGATYSTAQLLRKAAAEVVAAELKSAQKPEDQFETTLFLPEGEARKGEGGLRTKGLFKKSSEEKPLITVITVVFNGVAHLEEAILSVINQTYDNVEYIIIDGGSSDGTLDIVRKYEHAIDYWVSEKDNGIYDAMNKGIKLAIGNIIGFLNSDDILLVESFNYIVKQISIHGCFGYTCGKVERIDHDGRVEGLITPFCKEARYARRHLEMPCPHQSVFVHKQIYKRIGLFDNSYKLSADYDFMLKLIESDLPCIDLEKAVAQYRSGGLSGGMKSRVENYRIHRRHDVKLVKAIYFFMRSFIKTTVARYVPPFLKKKYRKYIPSQNSGF